MNDSKSVTRRRANRAARAALFVALTLSLLTLPGCGAEPRADDLDRIKSEFLTFRFQAPLNPRFADKSDLELFQLICAQNRVRCAPVLEMLRDSDPEFYEKLHAGQIGGAN